VEGRRLSDEIDGIALAGKRARGKRPAYFDDPAIDRLLSITMALAGELAVTRERLDTVERLLAAQGVLARETIEEYRPDRDAGYERGLAQRAFIARILRSVQQDMEALAREDAPVEDVIDRLRDL